MQNMRKGRPRIEVDPELFAAQTLDFREGKITAKQAASAVGISRKTFFRRLKDGQPENPAR